VQQFLPDSLYPLLNMMQGVIDAGTGQVVRRMGFRHPAGGKTGTTNDFKDAWFNAFTKDISASVWVGFDNNNPMKFKSGKGLTGASGAAPIWVHFMQKVLEGKSPIKFPVPDKIKFATVDVQKGYLANEFSLETLQVAVKGDVDLSAPAVLNVPELDETGLLPDPVNEPLDSKQPEKRNAVPNP